MSDDPRDHCEPYHPAPRHPHDRLIDFHGVVCADKHGAARGPCKWRGCPHGAPFRDWRVWWKGEGALPHELPEEALKP